MQRSQGAPQLTWARLWVLLAATILATQPGHCSRGGIDRHHKPQVMPSGVANSVEDGAFAVDLRHVRKGAHVTCATEEPNSLCGTVNGIQYRVGGSIAHDPLVAPERLSVVRRGDALLISGAIVLSTLVEGLEHKQRSVVFHMGDSGAVGPSARPAADAADVSAGPGAGVTFQAARVRLFSATGGIDASASILRSTSDVHLLGAAAMASLPTAEAELECDAPRADASAEHGGLVHCAFTMAVPLLPTSAPVLPAELRVEAIFSASANASTAYVLGGRDAVATSLLPAKLAVEVPSGAGAQPPPGQPLPVVVRVINLNNRPLVVPPLLQVTAAYFDSAGTGVTDGSGAGGASGLAECAPDAPGSAVWLPPGGERACITSVPENPHGGATLVSARAPSATRVLLEQCPLAPDVNAYQVVDDLTTLELDGPPDCSDVIHPFPASLSDLSLPRLPFFLPAWAANGEARALLPPPSAPRLAAAAAALRLAPPALGPSALVVVAFAAGGLTASMLCTLRVLSAVQGWRQERRRVPSISRWLLQSV